MEARDGYLIYGYEKEQPFDDYDYSLSQDDKIKRVLGEDFNELELKFNNAYSWNLEHSEITTLINGKLVVINQVKIIYHNPSW